MEVKNAAVPPPQAYGLESLNQAHEIERWETEGVTLSLSNDDASSITFKVDENPTTGFSWSIDPNGCPDDFVSIEQTYDAPAQFEEDAEPIMGAGGVAYFVVSAEEAGNCTFRIAYARSWLFNWEDKIDNHEKMIAIPVSVV